MELSNQILSEITVHMKYARYLEGEKRREENDGKRSGKEDRIGTYSYKL